MIRVSACDRCGETRVERDNVTACLGCGELVWPMGSLPFARYEGGAQKLELLFTLMRRQGLVHMESLAVALWGHATTRPLNEQRSIRVQMHYLRRQLSSSGFPGHIEGVRGRGYRIVLHQPAEAAA